MNQGKYFSYFCRMTVSVFLLFGLFTSGVFADNKQDRTDIEKLVSNFLGYLSEKNADGIMGLVSRDYLDSRYDRDGYRAGLEDIFSVISEIKVSCTIKAVDITEGGRASVTLEGKMESFVDTPRGQGTKTGDCNEFWAIRGGNYLRKENGAWKIAGSQKKVWDGKAAAGFLFTSPTDAQLVLSLHDASGGITSAGITVSGINSPFELSRHVDENENIAIWTMKEAFYIDTRAVVFPVKVVVKYTDGDGPGTVEYELEKPVVSFPLPLAPADTATVNCPVNFKWQGTREAGSFYRLDIMNENGDNIGSKYSDSEQADYPCEGSLAPGAVYFYKVTASDGAGNHFASGMESFRIGNPEQGPALKYTFSGPQDVTEYSGRPAAWIGGVYLYKDKIIVSDFLNLRLDVIDATTRSQMFSLQLDWTPRDYCAAGDSIFVIHPEGKKIRVFSFDGTPEGEWAFDSGGSGGPILCDEKNNRIMAANLASGTLTVFDLSGVKTGESAMPEKTAAIAAGEDGGMLYSDEEGVFHRYSPDGKPVAEWKYPESVPIRRGVSVFDSEGRLAGIDNPTFDPPGAVQGYPIALKESGGNIYAGYLLPNECGRCGMFFDAGPDGALVFSRDFR